MVPLHPLEYLVVYNNFPNQQKTLFLLRSLPWEPLHQNTSVHLSTFPCRCKFPLIFFVGGKRFSNLLQIPHQVEEGMRLGRTEGVALCLVLQTFLLPQKFRGL